MCPSTNDAYTYRELRPECSTRILQLEESNDNINTPLRCQLLDVTSLERPSYEALSYTWGTDAPQETLYIQDRDLPDRYYTMSITKNLHNALRHLRLSKGMRMLWVDAVCIDQTDHREKSRQVAQMGDIYRDAEQVLVWLGKLSPWHPAFPIRKCIDRIVEYSEHPGDLQFLVDTEDYWYNSTLKDIRHLFEMLALQLWKSEWFSRVWTIQEFVLARNVQFCVGSLQFDTAYISRGVEAVVTILEGNNVRWFKNEAERFLDQVYIVRDLLKLRQEYWYSGGVGHPLVSNVFDLTRRRHCTMAVDRIYSLLGISEPSALKPDYETHAEEVVQRFMKQNLEAGHFRILHECRPGSDSAGGPSWVPSLTSNIDEGDTMWHPMVSWDSGGRRDVCIEEVDQDRLSIRGVIVDTIIDCIVPTPRGEADPGVGSRFIGPYGRWVPAKVGFIEFLRLSNYKYQEARAADAEQELAITEASYPPYQNEPLYEAYLSTVKSVSTQSPWVVVDLNLRTTSLLPEEKFLYHLSQRNIIVTKSGYVGLANRHFKIDDEIVIFDGDATPFIIRKVKAEDETWTGDYRLVSDCYLHGWMNGDYFGHQVKDSEEIPHAPNTLYSQDFIIC